MYIYTIYCMCVHMYTCVYTIACVYIIGMYNTRFKHVYHREKHERFAHRDYPSLAVHWTRQISSRAGNFHVYVDMCMCTYIIHIYNVKYKHVYHRENNLVELRIETIPLLQLTEHIRCLVVQVMYVYTYVHMINVQCKIQTCVSPR